MACQLITMQISVSSRSLCCSLVPAPWGDRQHSYPMEEKQKNKRTAQPSTRKRKKEGSISSVTVAPRCHLSRLIDSLAVKWAVGEGDAMSEVQRQAVAVCDGRCRPHSAACAAGSPEGKITLGVTDRSRQPMNSANH